MAMFNFPFGPDVPSGPLVLRGDGDLINVQFSMLIRDEGGILPFPSEEN